MKDGGFFTQQLSKLPRDKYKTDFRTKSVWICCPFHNEASPSCKVTTSGNQYLGTFYCFGCKKKGVWNKLCEAVPGLTPIENENTIKNEMDFSFKAREQEEEVLNKSDLDKMIPWPEHKEWRGIPGSTLLRYDAKVEEGRGKRADEIYLRFPVMIGKDYVGYIRALGRKPRRFSDGSKELAYINSSGEWSLDSLFGYNQARAKGLRKDPLWVVEGPRDTLNVATHGGRVVGLIGSAVGESKISLIMQLNPPFIISATDPDEAGDGANAKLFEAFKGLIPIKRLVFKPNTDPADLTYERVQRVRKLAMK